MRVVLISLCIIALFTNVSAQIPVNQERALEILKNTTDGENWRVKDYTEMYSRTKPPLLRKYNRRTMCEGKLGYRLTTFDLRNNNLCGDISREFMTQGCDDRGMTFYGGQGLGETLLYLSHNQITSVPDVINCGKSQRITDVRLDNNKLTTLKIDTDRGTIGDGSRIITLHQNDITGISGDDLAVVNKYSPKGLFNYNYTKLFTIHNNRLDFSSLISINSKIEGIQKYVNRALIGSSNIDADYFPQKPLGGDYTEVILNEGDEETLSFNLRHPDNIYVWELNGKEAPLSQCNDYKIIASERTAGIYRCRITNPNMPQGTLYSYDMAVFLNKPGNNSTSDIILVKNTLCDSFPENALVANLKAVDPDGDQIFFRLPDKTADNSHFRITNQNTIVSSEILFEYKYIGNYKIIVEAYDKYGGKFQKEFIINKSATQPENPLPKDITLTNDTIIENTNNQFIGKLNIVDNNGYSLLLNDELDNSFFKIQNDSLMNVSNFDFESRINYNIRVTAKNGDFEIQKDFSVKVTNDNDAPYEIFITKDKFNCELNPGALIGQLMASDQDPGDTRFTFDLIESNIDNSYFVTQGSLLKLAKVTTGYKVFNLDVKVCDPQKLCSVLPLELTSFKEEVNMENKPPHSLFLSNNVIPCGSNNNDIIGTLNAFDPENKKLNYNCMSENFIIEGNNVRIKSMPEAESVTNLVVECSDGTNTIEKLFKIYNFEKNVYQLCNKTGLTKNCITEETKVDDVIAEIVTDLDPESNMIYDIDNEYLYVSSNQILLSSVPPSGKDINFTLKKQYKGVESEHSFTIYNKLPKGSEEPKPENTSPIGIGLTNNFISNDAEINDFISELYLIDKESISGTFTCDNEYLEIINSKIILKDIPKKNMSFDLDITGSDGEHSITSTFKFHYINDIESSNSVIPKLKTSIYPNPSSDQINVSFENTKKSNISISIFNTKGVVVFSEVYKDQEAGKFTKTLKLGKLDKGVYFIKIDNIFESLTRKIIKQ